MKTNGFDDISLTLKELKKYKNYFLFSKFGERGERASKNLGVEYF